MKYESLEEFIKRVGKSRSTIIRFYNANPEFEVEIKKRGRGNKKHYPISHAKYFSSELMFEENKQLISENKAMKNLIDCLMDKKSLQANLWLKDWTFFVTVAYTHERNKKSCYRMMNGLYDTLMEKYGELTELRIFFTTEPFTNRKGNHNHFVMYCSDEGLNESIQNDITEYFDGNRCQIEPYNRYEAGLFYMVKKGLVNEDWDILGNCLDKESKAA